MSVKITIEGDGLSFNTDTTLQKAGQILAFLGTDDSSTGDKQLQADSPLIVSPANNLSIKSSLDESKAKTNAQKITVIGEFLSVDNSAGEFLAKEVLLQLRKTGDEPGNFKRDLGTAVSLKYIYPISSKKGTYGVTERGKQAISDKFSGEIQVKIKPKGKGVFKKPVPPRDSVTSLSIVSEMEGYPSFHSLPTKADKILWVLAYADQNKISDLTPREVEHITDKLREKIPQSGFSAHNKRNINASYVSLTNNAFKLQYKGGEYLKNLNTSKENGKKEE